MVEGSSSLGVVSDIRGVYQMIGKSFRCSAIEFSDTRRSQLLVREMDSLVGTARQSDLNIRLFVDNVAATCYSRSSVQAEAGFLTRRPPI